MMGKKEMKMLMVVVLWVEGLLQEVDHLQYHLYG